MRTGHDDVEPSHGAGPYHAPESDNHNDNAYHICNVVISHILFNMILNMNIECNISIYISLEIVMIYHVKECV